MVSMCEISGRKLFIGRTRTESAEIID